ncbi:MAG: OmpA family protein [Candidatus Gracilibacteria bacterium]
MADLQKQEDNKNRVLLEYNNTQGEILKDLKLAFQDKEKEWEMTIDDDLSIKFTNPDVLFDPNVSTVTRKFQGILDEFIPLYVSIINNEKYKDAIVEVRIEGHAGKCDESEYMTCLRLSQERSNAVLGYIFSHSDYKNIDEVNKRKLKFWLTSNGMSNGKNLDNNGRYVFKSGNELDPKLSRRVEFRIVTNSEALAKTLIDSLGK